MKSVSPQARTAIVALLVIIVGVITTGFMYQRSRASIHLIEQTRFATLSDKIVAELEERMRLYQYGLRGTRSVFASSEHVTAAEFADCVASRDLLTEFPGSLGIGYVHRIRRDQLDSYVRSLHDQGMADFKIKTKGDHSELYVIQYIEPLTMNHQAWGLDIAMEDNRRNAADKAMLSGDWAITAPIQLVQESRPITGFLYLLPLYDKTMPKDTPEQRRQALVGWVYMPLVIDLIMKGIDAESQYQIDFDIFEGTQTIRQQLMYDSDGSADRDVVDQSNYAQRLYNRKVSIPIGGRTWTIWLSTTDRFSAHIQDNSAGIGMGGMVATLMLAGLVIVQGRSEGRARRIAVEMTETTRQQKESLRKVAMAASLTTDDVVIIDAKDRIEWVNSAFTRMFGFTLEEVQGQSGRRFLLGRKSDPATIERIQNTVFEEYRGAHCQVLSETKTGQEFWHDVEFQPVSNTAGELTQVIAIGRDVTQRKREADQLRMSEARFRAAIEGGFDEYYQMQAVRSDGVHINDLKIIDLNERAAHSLSMLRNQILDRGLLELFPGEGLEEIFRMYVDVIETGRSLTIEYFSKITKRWLGVQAVRVGDGVAVSIRDISERKTMEEQFRLAAQTDKLTTLPNRATLIRQMQLSAERATEETDYHFAILFLDFDGFKRVNDTYGHEAGDQLLIAITGRLCSTLRFKMREGMDEAPTVAARLGGDEFVVLARGIHRPEDAHQVADRLLASLNRPYAIAGHEIHSSASIGIATTLTGCHDADELLRQADTAMYVAKTGGKNRYVIFEPAMDKQDAAACPPADR